MASRQWMECIFMLNYLVFIKLIDLTLLFAHLSLNHLIILYQTELYSADDELLISILGLDKEPSDKKKKKERKSPNGDKKEPTKLKLINETDQPLAEFQLKVREENLAKLEEERRLEKKTTFERFLKLINRQEVNFDKDFLNVMNQVPLISDDMLQQENRNKLYDQKELELAGKFLLKTPNKSEYFFPSVSV